jgi:hypothetical protein
MSYKRVSGGEKNLKSGQRWSKEEIVQVYRLYKKLNGAGLHEYNPEIQVLADKLERTVRSTEAQTLMFRNLERRGDYSHGNMNKLSEQVWNEHELKRNIQLVLPFNDVSPIDEIQTNSIEERGNNNNISPKNNSDYIVIEDEENETEFSIYSYKKWNKLLVDYYFNSKKEEKEIQCFFVYKELFEQISENQFTYSDFELSITKIIRTKSFKDKFSELLDLSVPKVINGRNLRKPIPEYFGLLMYLILSLSESKSDDLNISNVYDRINEFGERRFENKWGGIDTSFARDVLELAWRDLEDWSINYKSKKLGYFIMKDPKRAQRKYVSRIERHGLFNSHHFQQLFDILIEIGIVPKEEIPPSKWLEVFKVHKHKISNSDKVIEYLNEESELKEIILKFINDYYHSNFIGSLISSHSGTIRKPAIPLILCLKELPQWDTQIDIDDIHFRAFSSELEEDDFEYQDAILKIEHEYKDYSKKITFNWEPNQENTVFIKGDSQRYSIKYKPKWLIHNRDLEEWCEVITPTNAISILLLVNKEVLESIQNEIGIEGEIYQSPWDGYSFIEFENLNEIYFKKIKNILGFSQIIDGKIELIGNFLLNRRTVILKEFESWFKYTGPIASPKLIAKCEVTNQEWELIKEPNQAEALFRINDNVPEDIQFFIFEQASQIKSHNSFSIGSLLSRDIINITRPYSKNEDGINIPEREINAQDIFDIPDNFNKKDFDNVAFNTWHKKLWKIFKPSIPDYITTDNANFIYSQNHKGEKLLNYLSFVTNIDTYKLPSLIRELNPTINSEFSKRIMHFWRDLGYINFESYGERVKVSPSNLIFVETEKGLKAFLTGFRNKVFINKLITICKELKLIINLTNHSETDIEILPYRIEIYDKLGNLDSFKTLAKKADIQFINNIENPYNSRYAIYQLACFYTQRSVNELDAYLTSKTFYETDHHRKLFFDSKKHSWIESTKNVSDMPDNTLIRYDGFKDRQMIHIYKDENGIRKLDDYSLCSFKLIEGNVFIKKMHKVKDISDFYVPLNMSLPYWIERGLIMTNARIPVLEFYQNKSYRVYQNIHDDVIRLIENKLNQQCNII